VQAALDRLRTEGAVICQPAYVGYRSAFIGAVLRTIPGATITLHPPTVSLGSSTGTGPLAPLASGPVGALDASAVRPVRLEQLALRRALLGNRSHAPCAFCGHELPADLLVAAHIKQRNLCSDEEKRDLANIGMLACKLGCDDLYELGYITVNDDGVIISTDPRVPQLGNHLSTLIARLAGQSCRAFTIANANYFKWHRETRFRRTT
jgi:hypothetical protein